MARRGMALLVLGLLGAGPAWPQGTAPGDLALPAPRTSGGRPLMDVLRDRHSVREFSAQEIPAQVLSDLLWAACGVNRPGDGKRTAPSAHNWQELDVYAVLATGAYRYDARAHRLVSVAQGDLRPLAGTQPFVATAPLNLVYVADTARMAGASPEDQALYLGADTGFVGQNVYLFCASEGLATVVRASVDRAPLARALGLGPQHRVVLAQTVGYPATPSR
ncbi:MAG: SagB/ThcOx family dehydrogenase [Candidatus Latescibacterota bacterium]